jgi:hypothetical protein
MEYEGRGALSCQPPQQLVGRLSVGLSGKRLVEVIDRA